MLSKVLAKYINSLKTKKGRKEHGCYVLEGEKLVLELLHSQHRFTKLIATDEWLDSNQSKVEITDVIVCTKIEMEKISSLQTPSPLLAVAEIPVHTTLPDLTDIAIVLDGLQDPGNLGTIIRTADWFGLKNIFVSTDTVDVYNPKTVQSAMGSLLRVHVIEKDLEELFKHYSNVRVVAADTNGIDIRTETSTPEGIPLGQPVLLLIGNEGNGIKNQWQPYIHKTISIPRFGNAESLNAAVATAIICSYWKLK